MVKEKVVSVTIAIPKSYRDLLRKMALEESLKNPDQMVTVSCIGRRIICAHLKEELEGRNKKEDVRED